jgi:hypothetical protein
MQPIKGVDKKGKEHWVFPKNVVNIETHRKKHTRLERERELYRLAFLLAVKDMSAAKSPIPDLYRTKCLESKYMGTADNILKEQGV